MRPGHRKRLPNAAIGLIAVILVAIGSFLAFNKKLPWTHGFQVKAVFATAQNIRVKSPVRIAGVNVGTVTSVQHLTTDDPEYKDVANQLPAQPKGSPPGIQAAVVTMELNNDALPIHQDATMKLRPRLFLEGNLFVDVHPGTPESPDISDGYTFPPSQTSSSVQLDQVLTTLQSGVRRDLQLFLGSFGDALTKYGGAQGFQTYFKTSAPANKYTAQVNEAVLGTQPGDLSGLVKNLDSTVRALNQEPAALQGTVTNLDKVTGAFAAHDQSLKRAVPHLDHALKVGEPALAALDASFPPLQTFAREVLPGVRSTPEALDAATPLLNQVRGLVSQNELRGLVHDLKPAIPELSSLSKKTIPFLNQSRALSSCFNQVVIPWSNDTVFDPNFPAQGKVYEETGYGLTGINGESRSGDANGQYIRVAAGGGTNTLYPGHGFTVVSQPQSASVPFVGYVESALLGARPMLQDSLKTPFRPDVPCETQDPPNLGSSLAPAPPQTPVGSGSLPGPLQSLSTQAQDYLTGMGKAMSIRGQDKQKSNTEIQKTAGAWAKFTQNVWPNLANQLRALGGGG